ncbi:hypothetical protein FDP41_001803 [Naegleria fowleri]|uniref:Phosphatidic acid phosphatase type 2/haloperoxidase domain-containing protein n=1 Tax=Naegleria fowleri TaxID=5763 RepID=A0A6A5C0T2_NAEFO|nr:uncharacterized protein FDP41_001803 [Naegleria fowleri]KAF0979460.1 hypothetical protein FDP41_001803 [Naegleria fowleri]
MLQPSREEDQCVNISSQPSSTTFSSSSSSVVTSTCRQTSSPTFNTNTPKLSNAHQHSAADDESSVPLNHPSSSHLLSDTILSSNSFITPPFSSSSSTEDLTSKSVHHHPFDNNNNEKNKELFATSSATDIIASLEQLKENHNPSSFSDSPQEQVVVLREIETTLQQPPLPSPPISSESPTQTKVLLLSEQQGSSFQLLSKEHSLIGTNNITSSATGTTTTTTTTTISTTSSSSELRKRKKISTRQLLERNIIMLGGIRRGDGYLNSPHNRSSSSLDGVFDVITDYYYNNQANGEEHNEEENGEHEQHHLLNGSSADGGLSLEDGKIVNTEEIVTSEEITQPQVVDSKSDTHSIEEEHHEKTALVQQETLSSLEETSSTLIMMGDYEKFVYRIPPKFENYWKSFDDKIISIIQFKPNIVFFILSMIVTALTTIEIGILAPVVLYILGIDNFASYVMWVILTLSMLSQLPKRFMFRVRPYLASRAKCIAKDKTSSFPSRAVTCSVVYAFLVCYFIRCVTSGESMSDVIFWIWCIPCCFLSAIAASAARIYLGVHYPSDCLFGALQGLVSIILGTICYLIHLSVCATCAGNADSKTYWNGLMPCYAPLEESVNLITVIGRSNLSHVNWYLFCILSIGSLLLGILFVTKPIQFYTKFHHVFSMLAPCLTFQYCFLCPTLSLNGIATIPKPSLFSPWFSYLYAAIVGIVFTAAGMKAPKKYSLIAFPILYILVFCALFFWRSCIFQQSS